MRACGEAVVEPGEWECSLRGKMSRQRGHPVMGSQEGDSIKMGKSPIKHPVESPSGERSWQLRKSIRSVYSWAPTNREVLTRESEQKSGSKGLKWRLGSMHYTRLLKHFPLSTPLHPRKFSMTLDKYLYKIVFQHLLQVIKKFTLKQFFSIHVV